MKLAWSILTASLSIAIVYLVWELDQSESHRRQMAQAVDRAAARLDDQGLATYYRGLLAEWERRDL